MLRIAVGQRTHPVPREPLEAKSVHRVGFDVEHVARCPLVQRIAGKGSAERGYVDLDRMRGGRRRNVPEPVDKRLDGNDMPCLERERREQGALLPRGDRDGPVAVCDLERAEQAYLHRPMMTGPRAFGNA